MEWVRQGVMAGIILQAPAVNHNQLAAASGTASLLRTEKPVIIADLTHSNWMTPIAACGNGIAFTVCTRIAFACVMASIKGAHVVSRIYADIIPLAGIGMDPRIDDIRRADFIPSILRVTRIGRDEDRHIRTGRQYRQRHYETYN